ncbi:hypothetical protein SLU01_19110 [Sporosarcina luteola]|uniref:Uncharacterized protein n=1 Tax=Sporosarcina luteola TaxID=582850 RepID=A0A511Z829_9BACL|nr:hypothetical protein [Sporosarcina luteola]GEN83599.1 hypothetical protein SLU01_19110 [Sporosarcina luteola]
MMVTVREMFDFAIETDGLNLAHRIYWALSENLVQLEDDSEKLDAIHYDESAIYSMVERNVLSIGRIKLFVIQTSNEKWYSFILAENSLDAYRLYADLFREKPRKVTRSDRLMIPTMDIADTGQQTNLYEYRKNVVQFPAYVGHAEANTKVLYRMGVSA